MYLRMGWKGVTAEGGKPIHIRRLPLAYLFKLNAHSNYPFTLTRISALYHLYVVRLRYLEPSTTIPSRYISLFYPFFNLALASRRTP